MKSNLKSLATVLALAMVLSTIFSGFAFAADGEGNNQIDRVEGDDRYETAALTSLGAFGEGADSVIVARGDKEGGFADGLAASYLAGVLDAPILLTRPTVLPDETADAIQQFDPSEVLVLGNEVAISDEVVDAIGELGYVANRVAGETRVETSLDIAEKAGIDFDKVYITDGWASADAMVAGASAFDQNIPVIVDNTKTGEVSDPVKEALNEWGVSSALIVGGTGVVSEAYANDLEEEGVNVDRVGGDNRIETSLAFAEREFEEVNAIQIVNGWSHADAVGASVNGDPIVYLHNHAESNFNGVAYDYIGELLANNANLPITIYGGDVALGKEIEAQLTELVGAVQLSVTSVDVADSKTVTVEFNNDIEAAKANNFRVYEESDWTIETVVEEATAEGNVVTLELADELSDGTDYVLEVDGVTSVGGAILENTKVNFSYNIGEPASIAFANTTAAPGEEFEIVIEDADGKDVTSKYLKDVDYELNESGLVEVDTDNNVLKAKADSEEGFAVVNAKVIGDDNKVLVETGNTILEVKAEEAAEFDGIKWTVVKSGENADYENPNKTMYDEGEYKLSIQLVDEDGQALNNQTPNSQQIKSLTPKVALIDNATDKIQVLTTGTAEFEITVRVGDKQVRETATVTIKEAPRADLLNVDPTSITLTSGSNIEYPIAVEVLDQYGEVITTEGFTLESNDTDIVVVGDDNTIGVGEETGKTTVTVSYGELEDEISVEVVEPAEFDGYEVVVSDTTLDLNNDEKSKHKQGPQTTTVKVYTKDVNGHYLEEITTPTVDLVNDKNDAISIDGATITAKNTGTADVRISAEGKVLTTETITVVNSTPVATDINQLKEVVIVDGSNPPADVATFLLGEDDESAAFIVYNQYGEKMSAAELADLAITNLSSSNSEVLNIDDKGLEINKNGTATLSAEILGKVYSLTVVVVNYE